MRKVSIEITNNSLIFSFLYVDPSILNVSIGGDENGFVFSEEYIKNNEMIFLPYIKVLIKSNIKTIVIKNIELLNLILKIISSLDTKIALNINTDDFIDSKTADRIIIATNISKLICHTMDTKTLKNLSSCNINVELTLEELALSNFAHDNDLKNKASLVNKENVKIIQNLNNNDIKDFETFCKLNKDLKNIYLYGFPQNNAEKLFDNMNFKNKITITLYVDSNNINAFQKSIKNIKKLTRKYRKNKNLNFEIVYSEEYIKQNYFRQLALVTLKTCSIIAIIFTISIGSLLAYNNYTVRKDVSTLQNLVEGIDLLETETSVDNNERDISKEDNEKFDLKEDYADLLAINDETIGWLKVPNTDVNFPVVQTNDNVYYLNRSFYKKSNYQGWAYVDYKNDLENLDQNTIIYGHNGIIFGSLHNTLKKSWHSNKENHIITFNTLYGKMTFQIFSIYKTSTDFNYIINNFSKEEDYDYFLKEIKNRSVFDFNIELDTSDRLLTLSTCIDNGFNRVVVHAKKIS